MNHIRHSSIRKAHDLSITFIAAVLIVAIGWLVACENGGETSRSNTGSIKLTLTFPAFTGAQAITKLNVRLKRADGTGESVTLDKIKEDFSDTGTGDDTNITTLDFDSVPAGQYLLFLTFYRNDAIAALCIEGVGVRRGKVSDKWLNSDGGTYSKRSFMPDEFRSMDVAASFILRNKDKSIVPLNMGDPLPTGWELDMGYVQNEGIEMELEISLHGGPGTSLIAVTLNGDDKLSLFTTTNGGATIPVYRGILDIGTGAMAIDVAVQAPDRYTTKTYTIRQSP